MRLQQDHTYPALFRTRALMHAMPCPSCAVPAAPAAQVRLVRTQGFVTRELEAATVLADRSRAAAEGASEEDDSDEWMDPGAAFV
jgi:hypothetical protein